MPASYPTSRPGQKSKYGGFDIVHKRKIFIEYGRSFLFVAGYAQMFSWGQYPSQKTACVGETEGRSRHIAEIVINR